MKKILQAMPKYESYKNSGFEWIGEIPSHWEVKPLRRISKVHSGNGFPIELQGEEDGNIPFIKVSDFSASKRFISLANNHVSEKVISRKNWNKVPKGCLVTAKIGEALRKNHRNLLSCDAIIDNNCIGLEAISVDFLYFFYLNKIIDFDWFVNPGAIPSISVQKYRSWSVGIPPIEEQTAIAKFLDEKTAQIDQAIGIKEQQIALLKERKQIIIQNAVTKGLNPNAPMKDSGIDWIGDIPAHWEVTKLKLIGKAIIGLTYDPNNLCGKKNGTLVLRASNLKDGEFVYGDKLNAYVNVKVSDKLTIKKNDILICSRNGSRDLIGKCAIAKEYDEGVTFGAFTTVFRSEINSYLIQILNSEIFRFLSGSFLTSTINQLTIGNLNSISVPLPPYKEQKELKKYLEKERGCIDETIKVQQTQINNLKEYKASLINAAVTGKIKIN